VDAVQGGQEPLQDAQGARDDDRKALQYPTATQVLSIVDDDFEAEHTLAFGIRLEGQLAEMQLEHRQVIHKMLEHDLQPRSTFPAPLGATAHAKQRSHLAHIQSGAGPVNHTLKDLLQL